LESSINLVFVPPATGDYRVLTGCALNDGYAVDTELLVSKIQVIEPAWKADLVDRETGQDMFPYSTYTTSAPDGTVYTISNTFCYGMEGSIPYLDSYRLFAFSQDGTQQWAYDLPLPSYTQPLVGPDGTIYVATAYGTTDESEDDSNDDSGSSYIIALNPDGSEKWVKEFKADSSEGEMLIYDFGGQMALSKSGVLVLAYYNVGDACHMMAVDVNNSGEVLWIKGSDSDYEISVYNSWSSPVIYEDTVYVPARYTYSDFYGIAAFRLSDGQELWAVGVDDCCGPADCNIAIDRDGTIYLVGDGEIYMDEVSLYCPVYAIDRYGNVKWIKDIGMEDQDSFPIAVNDKYIYIGNSNVVYILDKETGDVVKKIPTTGYNLISLTVFDDGSLGLIFAGYLEDGLVFKKLSPEGGILATFSIPYMYDLDHRTLPTVTRDGYLAIAVEGVLYCFDMGAGLDSGWTINAGNSAYTNSVALNTVKFESNGGTDVADQEVYTGDKAEKPVDPTRGSEAISETATRVYTFDKWYIDEACTMPYDFSNAVMGDITLYAGWLYEDRTGQTEPTEPVNPPTGDSGNLILWLALSIAALVMMGSWTALYPRLRNRCQ